MDRIVNTDTAKKRVIINGESVPRLEKHAKLVEDHAREKWVLLAPERMFELTESSLAILQLCDGENSVDKIVALLANEYAAPIAEIKPDVFEMLQSLLDKKLLSI